MTLSITNHELFGIRGIIRGRIAVLQAKLAREKDMVVSRDQRIKEMQSEIEQLHVALHDFSEHETPTEQQLENTPLTRLTARFPVIDEIRNERLLGNSPLWYSVFEQAVLAAQGLAPALIVGESGTGKTDIAWTIHRLSDRRENSYKEVSCAQFEHADPAFALGRLFGIGIGHGLPNVPKEGRKGLLEECDGGTLFLDDFDRLPLNVQDLLLYPMEQKPFEPGIGSGPPCTVSIKFLFATNRDPHQLVDGGHLRADVLARMHSRVDLPPLRERTEDIPLLVQHFAQLAGEEIGHQISLVSPKSMNLLCRFPFRAGNARELKAEIEKAVGKAMLEDDTVLRAGYLSERVRAAEGDVTPPGNKASVADHRRGDSGMADSTAVAVLRKHNFQVKPAEVELGYSHKSKTLSHHLRGICIEALSNNSWDADRAAQALAGGQPMVVQKLKGKMERFMANIRENIARNTETRLYKNLPVNYHRALDRALEHVKGSSGGP